MSRMPAAPQLPRNVQSRPCPKCLALGTVEPMLVVLYRDMAENHGNIAWQCKRCGDTVEGGVIPLAMLTAQSMPDLHDAYRRLGVPGLPEHTSDLSDVAKALVETYGLNPLVLAEYAARLTEQYARATDELAEVREEAASA